MDIPWLDLIVDEPRIRACLDSTLHISELRQDPHDSHVALLVLSHSTRRVNLASSILDVLQLSFPRFDNWHSRSVYGGLFVNGRPMSLDLTLSHVPLPARLEYYEPRGPWENRHSIYPKFDPNWIIYHQHGLLIAFKPFDLPTKVPKNQNHHSLQTYLGKYFDPEGVRKQTIHFPSRLDSSTGGIVAMSTNQGS